MRKVYVEVTTRIIMQMDDGVEVDDVISEMHYDFEPATDDVDFVDTEIREYIKSGINPTYSRISLNFYL